MTNEPVANNERNDETVDVGSGNTGGTPSYASPPTETQELIPSSAGAGIPKQVGRYKILNPIGSGGMGTVYAAMQEHPRRTVAVKLMKTGVTSRSALRRFEFESQH